MYPLQIKKAATRRTLVRLWMDEGDSQAEVARQLGITRQRVSQMLKKPNSPYLFFVLGGYEIEVEADTLDEMRHFLQISSVLRLLETEENKKP